MTEKQSRFTGNKAETAGTLAGFATTMVALRRSHNPEWAELEATAISFGLTHAVQKAVRPLTRRRGEATERRINSFLEGFANGTAIGGIARAFDGLSDMDMPSITELRDTPPSVLVTEPIDVFVEGTKGVLSTAGDLATSKGGLVVEGIGAGIAIEKARQKGVFSRFRRNRE